MSRHATDPYFIAAADGQTSYGRTDVDGNLPRIETQGAIDYTVYWGDAALAKQQETDNAEQTDCS